MQKDLTDIIPSQITVDLREPEHWNYPQHFTKSVGDLTFCSAYKIDVTRLN